MQGLHLTADLSGCRCQPALLTDAAALEALCARAVQDAGLTLVADRYHAFPPWQGQPGGVTAALLLAESHLAVHTWPERAGVTLDVYVCNFSTDNSGKAQALLDALLAAFRPARRQLERLNRGQDRDDELLLEWLDGHTVHGVRARRLETLATAHQRLDVFESEPWGRLFRLDDAFMTSEKDEFLYHENMVHTAAVPHPAPRRALVLGGGDGGSAEELLKHPTMERVLLCELDADVIDVARRHFQSIHRGALDDPRTEIRIGDGFAAVRALAADPDGERFDLVVLDLTDPDTPAARLYTPEFFRAARAVLAPGGALTLHLGAPFVDPERPRRLVAALREVFALVRPFTVHVPLYGALWAMAVASDTLDPLATGAEEIDARIAARALPDLRFFNGDVHHAVFALPNHLRQLWR